MPFQQPMRIMTITGGHQWGGICTPCPGRSAPDSHRKRNACAEYDRRLRRSELGKYPDFTFAAFQAIRVAAGSGGCRMDAGDCRRDRQRQRKDWATSCLHFAFLLTPQTPVRPANHSVPDHRIPLAHEDITAFVVRAIDFCTRYAWPVIGLRAGPDRCVVLVCGDAFLHDHRHQQADLHRHAVAAARDGVREGVPAIRIDRRGDRRADAGTGRRGKRRTGRSACPSRRICSVPSSSRKAARSSRRTAFCSRPTEQLGPQMKNLTQAQRLLQVLAGDPSLRGVIQRAAIRPARRAGRPHHARRHDMAADARRRRDREGQRRAAGELFLARHGSGHAPRARRAATLLNIQGGARLFGAGARAEGDRRHPQGCRRSQVRVELSGARAPDRPGADGRRGIRHDQGERRRSTPPSPSRSCCSFCGWRCAGSESSSPCSSASSSGSRSPPRSAC